MSCGDAITGFFKFPLHFFLPHPVVVFPYGFNELLPDADKVGVIAFKASSPENPPGFMTFPVKDT